MTSLASITVLTLALAPLGCGSSSTNAGETGGDAGDLSGAGGQSDTGGQSGGGQGGTSGASDLDSGTPSDSGVDGGDASNGEPSGCVDKVGNTNTALMIINHPNGLCDTYGSFTLSVATGTATVTNVTLFRTDDTGLNVGTTAEYFTHGVWSTATGAQNFPGNYVAHLFIATTPNPTPDDFVALTGDLSLVLAAGTYKIYFFADADDTQGGNYGFGLNVWLGGAAAASPSLSAFVAVPGGDLMPDGTTGCSPAYDGTCGTSANALMTAASPTVTLTSFTVTGVGGATAPDAGAPGN